MLEALTKRYYRIRTFTRFRSLTSNGHGYACAEYDYEGKHIHVFATHADYAHLSESMQALFPLIAAVPADHDIVIDFYTWHQARPNDPDATQLELQRIFSESGFPRAIRRIVVAVAGPGRGEG